MAGKSFRNKETQKIINEITKNIDILSAKQVTCLAVFSEKDNGKAKGIHLSYFSICEHDGAILCAIAEYLNSIASNYDFEELMTLIDAFTGIGGEYLGYDISDKVMSDLDVWKCKKIDIYENSVDNPYFTQKEFSDILYSQQKLYLELSQRPDIEAGISLVLGQDAEVIMDVVGEREALVNVVFSAIPAIFKSIEADEKMVLSFTEVICNTFLNVATSDVNRLYG